MEKLKLIIVLLSLFVYCHGAIDAGVQNKNVERTIDIASQLVKISYKISVMHASEQNINTYSFVLKDKEREHLAYISAKDASKKELKFTESNTSHGTEFAMQLTGKTSSHVIYIETVFTKLLVPHPAEITQAEKQLVRYYGNVHFYSPYKTHLQKTTVLLGSKNVESFTQMKPVSHVESTITYGPYEHVQDYSDVELVVHYENNNPFLTVTRLERTIELSHWGNIAIEETIDMVHTGAKLKGSFSRYDFQKDSRSAQSCVKMYKTILPASATGVYYRDTNGNISTSNMKVLKDSVELDLRPRFPLFGGWKTHYTLGYNVPSFEYLYNNGENYLLKMRVIDHIFDDMLVDELVLKIILPEGSTNIKLVTPYPVTRLADSLHYTYLDTFGRPVISFTKKNLVENHIHDFNLKYNFAQITMLQEPLLLIGFLFILFLLVIIFMRLDFTITKEKEAHYHKE